MARHWKLFVAVALASGLLGASLMQVVALNRVIEIQVSGMEMLRAKIDHLESLLDVAEHERRALHARSAILTLRIEAILTGEPVPDIPEPIQSSPENPE